MLPTFARFRLADLEISISTYGVLLCLGVLVALLGARRAAVRAGGSPERVLVLGIWMVVAGLLAARGGYWLLRLDSLWQECATAVADERLSVCTRPARIWEGGLVWYAGVAGALVAAAVYCRRAGLPFLATADLFAAPAALGHAIGRLGCLAEACCYGKPAVPPAFGLSFVRDSTAYDDYSLRGLISLDARSTPPLHPTQLYEALADLVLFGLLVGLGRRARRPGLVVAAYLGSYAAIRFFVEMFRGDPGRRLLAAITTPDLARRLGLSPDAPTFLSVAQAASVTLLLAAAGLMLVVLRKRSGPA